MSTLSLTRRDEAVFCWLWMLRAMTIDQIRRVHFFQPESSTYANLNNVRTRLKRLENAGFLLGEMIRPEQGDTRQKVYFLGAQALVPLKHYGIVQRRIGDFKALHANRQIYHALMVAECAVSIHERVRGTGTMLRDLQPFHMPFYHTHAIGDRSAQKHVLRYITQEDVAMPDQVEPFRIRPDLVFALEKDYRARLFFLEADRGFESHEELSRKLAGYHHYAQASTPPDSQQRQWHRYGVNTDFRVLLVTSSSRRLGHVWNSLRQTPGMDLCAMTTYEAVQSRDIVHDTIWKTHDGQHRALMRRTI